MTTTRPKDVINQPEPLASDVIAVATLAAIFIGHLPTQTTTDVAYQNADAVLLGAREYLISQQDPEKNLDLIRAARWISSPSRYGRITP